VGEKAIDERKPRKIKQGQIFLGNSTIRIRGERGRRPIRENGEKRPKKVLEKAKELKNTVLKGLQRIFVSNKARRRPGKQPRPGDKGKGELKKPIIRNVFRYTKPGPNILPRGIGHGEIGVEGQLMKVGRMTCYFVHLTF